MQGCEDMRFKHHAVIECLTAGKIPPIDMHHHMQAVYEDKCVDVSTDIGYSSFSKKKWGKQVSLTKQGLGGNRTEFINFLNVGKNILKLEEIMWKSDYAQF